MAVSGQPQKMCAKYDSMNRDSGQTVEYPAGDNTRSNICETRLVRQIIKIYFIRSPNKIDCRHKYQSDVELEG